MKERAHSLWVILAAVILAAGCGTPALPTKAEPQVSGEGTDPQQTAAEAKASPNPGVHDFSRLNYEKQQPTYRWKAPGPDADYLPLPNGILLTWDSLLVTPRSAGDFHMSASKTDEQVCWTWQLPTPPGQVLTVDVSTDGTRVLVVEHDGRVHVVGAKAGEELATLQVMIGNPDTDEVAFIANGRYVAVKRRTPSGLATWVVDVYPAVSGARRSYGTEGRVVHLSPHHDLLMGLQAEGVEVRDSGGRLGVIPFSGDVQSAMAELSSSADGAQLLVFLKGRGLSVYDRLLREQHHMQLDDFSPRNFAPIGQVLWHQQAVGRQVVIRGGRELATVHFDAKAVLPREVMPAGERVFRAVVGGQAQECVVSPDITIRGCYDRVISSGAYTEAGTLFWTVSDGFIDGYR